MAFIVASFWSDILNIILPTNTSRAHHLLIKTEYLIDQEKYFYLILLHAIVSVCIGGIATLAIGTMLFTYLQHICGMFKIARYWHECINDRKDLDNLLFSNKVI